MASIGRSRAVRGAQCHGDGRAGGGSPCPGSVRGGGVVREVRDPVRGRRVPKLDLDSCRGYGFVSSGGGRREGTPPERRLVEGWMAMHSHTIQRGKQ